MTLLLQHYCYPPNSFSSIVINLGVSPCPHQSQPRDPFLACELLWGLQLVPSCWQPHLGAAPTAAHSPPSSPVGGGGWDLSPGSCLGQQLALHGKLGMRLLWLLKIMGIPGLLDHRVQAASFQMTFFTRPKYPGSPTSLRQSDPICSPQSWNFWVLLFNSWQLVGHGVLQSSETGERHAGLSHCQFSSSQQLGAWSFSGTQEWTHMVYGEGGCGEVRRLPKSTWHSRRTKRNQCRQSWEGKKAKEKQLARAESDKKCDENHYTKPLSSFTKLGLSYINSNKSKAEGQTKKG